MVGLHLILCGLVWLLIGLLCFVFGGFGFAVFGFCVVIYVFVGLIVMFVCRFANWCCYLVFRFGVVCLLVFVFGWILFSFTVVPLRVCWVYRVSCDCLAGSVLARGWLVWVDVTSIVLLGFVWCCFFCFYWFLIMLL